MVDPQTSRFWRVALQSGLLDEPALQKCWDQLPEDKRTPDAIDRRLARQAVNANLITIWQAQQLMTGRATGFRIDRYILLDLLGQGGMGRVYLAKDTRLGRQVAIKVLSTSRMNNPRAIARFQREGKVGAQLQHENLVRIYDEGESSQIRYLVMEFIEGKNVSQLIGEQGAIAWPAAVRLARQVALGLEHAHQKGLIHRDVNPSNILVTRDGTAKLTDLGLAIDLADEGNVTRDGATVGTFDYISPEQAKHSRDVDTRADIYSLGCSLYHMIAGRVPFPMPSLPEKLYAHQLHEADPLHALVSDVPEALSRIVAKMMAKTPEDRYPTPAVVAAALEPFVDESVRLKPVASTGLRSGSGDAVVEAARTRIAAPVKIAAAENAAAAGAAQSTTNTTPAPADEAKAQDGGGSAFVSDPDLAIFSVNTGPDEPLMAVLQNSNRSKQKSRLSKSNSGESKENGLLAKNKAWIGIVAAVVGILVLGAAVAFVLMRPKNPAENQTKGQVASGTGQKKKGKTTDAADAVNPPPAPVKHAPIEVVAGRDVREVEKLSDAIQLASTGNGEVVLNSTSPIRINSSDALRVVRGEVTIRGQKGASPIIAVEVSNHTTPITVLPGAALTLKGITIIGHYQTADRGVAHPLPLIDSGGILRLENSGFISKGNVHTSAVHHQGSRLEANGCLFSGFTRTIDAEAYPKCLIRITQCMIVRTAEGKDSRPWAVRMKQVSTAADKQGTVTRNVEIDHSTILGTGVLEAIDFSPTHPLGVKFNHNAVQTRAMLAWMPVPNNGGQIEWSKSLKWAGVANRYDITGGSWIMVSAEPEKPMVPSPGDLKAWNELLKTDMDSVGQSFKFAADTATLIVDGAIDPASFELVGDNIVGVGADPKKVGGYIKADRSEAKNTLEPLNAGEPEKEKTEGKDSAKSKEAEKTKTSKYDAPFMLKNRSGLSILA